MRLYPAIDIKNGKCVRLKQGQFENVNIYSDEPAEVALRWQECGAEYIHLVDLDGALAGYAVNEEAVKKILKAVTIPVEIGGGIRTIQDVERKLSLGISRVIIGTKAVENPAIVEEFVNKFGSDRIAVGIDAKDGIVAIKGWESLSRYNAIELAKLMKNIGVSNIIYTDIAKDGMMSGPNFDYTGRLVTSTGMNIIASGGVTTLSDLERLETLEVEGAIIGKALYEKTIDLAEAVKRFNTGKRA